MGFKPGDLFFTVVDFFSVIIPGAMTLVLTWNYIQPTNNFPIIQGSVAETLAFLLIAYLLGQILIALASQIDKLYDKWQMPKSKRLRNIELAKSARKIFVERLAIKVPEKESVLVWTDAKLRSTDGIDLTHIEFLEAESKFFRSMLLILPFYAAFFAAKAQPLLGIIVLALIPFSYWRYAERRVKRTMETYRLFIVSVKEGNTTQVDAK